MKKFTAFIDKKPEQGRWMLVTDDLSRVSERGEPVSLRLAYGYEKNERDDYFVLNTMPPNFFVLPGIDRLIPVTHWRYAFTEQHFSITDSERKEAVEDTKMCLKGAKNLIKIFPDMEHEKDIRVLKTILKTLGENQ